MYIIEVKYLYFNAPRWDLFSPANGEIWHTEHYGLAKLQARHLVTDFNLGFMAAHVINLAIREGREKARNVDAPFEQDEIAARFFKDKIGT